MHAWDRPHGFISTHFLGAFGCGFFVGAFGVVFCFCGFVFVVSSQRTLWRREFLCPLLCMYVFACGCGKGRSGAACLRNAFIHAGSTTRTRNPTRTPPLSSCHPPARTQNLYSPLAHTSHTTHPSTRPTHPQTMVKSM
jgi:hypothetical protein